MSTCAWVVIFALSAACSTRTPTARERALAQLPSTAQLVAAADGPALANPTFRRLVDVARPHAPAKLGCVIDAALVADAIALAVDVEVGTTIVIVTQAVVANCPALSKIAGDRYVATIGDGAVVDRAQSVLDAARWARARPFLLRDPIAVALYSERQRVIAVAQPDPIDAWITIDTLDADAALRDVRGFVSRWQALASKLIVHRDRNQIAVHSAKLGPDELTMIVTDLLRAADQAATVPGAPFTCAPTGKGITSCKDGTRYKVESVADTLRTLSNADAVPVIVSGDVVGTQLNEDAEVLLTRGDIILGLDSHRITNQFQLRELARHVGDHAALAVRRGTREVVIDLSE